MTDLSGKFTGLESQLSTQHGEIIDGINSILTALGAPPSTPTVTLADVVTALTQTNTILNGIRSDMNGYLLEIFNTVDLINNNSSLNAQRIIAALAQLYCPCDGDAPLLPPPLGTNPTSAEDIAKCARIQYFLNLFTNFVNGVSTYVGSGAAVSGEAINTILVGELLSRDISTGELASSGGIPVSVRSTVVDQLANQIVLVGRNTVAFELLGINLPEVSTVMTAALYGADNAAAGKSAFDAALTTTTIPNKYYEIMQTLFYSAWANDIYSDVPIVDTSEYDGTICAPTGNCVELTSDNVITNSNGTYYVITPTSPYSGDPSAANSGDYNGYTVKLLSGDRINPVTVGFFGTTGIYQGVADLQHTNDMTTIPGATAAIIFFSVYNAGDGHYTIELCEPDPS